MKTIEYRQIVGEELKEVHRTLAAGNQAVRRIAGLPGMSSDRHLQYRRALLGLRNDCTDAELAVIRRHGRGVRALLEAVEGLKPRLLEGFVALITGEARRALPRALWNCRQADDRRRLAEDLEQQACLAFWEAVYGYTNPKVYLSTYATTTIRNNLNRYVLDSQARSLPSDVAEMVRLYREAEEVLAGRSRPAEFLDVVAELLCRAEPSLRRSPAGVRVVIGSMADELDRLRRALTGTEPLPGDGLLPRSGHRSSSGVADVEAADELAAQLGLGPAERAVLAVAVLGEGRLDLAALERVRRSRGPRPGETAGTGA